LVRARYPRLANEILGAPGATANADGLPPTTETFHRHFDLPGIDTDNLEVTEEHTLNGAPTERRAAIPEEAVYRAERPARPMPTD